jgi:hypothetical protein
MLKEEEAEEEAEAEAVAALLALMLAAAEGARLEVSIEAEAAGAGGRSPEVESGSDAAFTLRLAVAESDFSSKMRSIIRQGLASRQESVACDNVLLVPARFWERSPRGVSTCIQKKGERCISEPRTKVASHLSNC